MHASAGRPGVDPAELLPKDWTLEWLIFDTLQCNPAVAHVRDLTEPKTDMLTPEQVRDEALDPKTGFPRIKELYALADRHYRDVVMVSETGDEEPLTAIVKRAGDDRLVADGKRQPPQTRQPEARPAQQETAPATAEVRVDPDAEEKWVGAFYGRLKDSSAEIHYRQRRSEAERAVATHEITRATADQRGPPARQSAAGDFVETLNTGGALGQTSGPRGGGLPIF